MKVIIANGGFLPAKTYGGPVVSIDNLCRFLYKDIEFYVVCTDHELGSSDRLKGIHEGWNDIGYCKVCYFKDSEVTEQNLNKVVKEVNPDTIYINSLFDARWTIPLLRIAKKQKISVLLAPRGQLCKNAFTRKYKKIPYIMYLRMFGLINNIHFQSTSTEETEAIRIYLKGTMDKVHYLSNLPSMPQTTLIHPIKKSGRASFVFFSRIVPKKNLINAIKFFRNVNGKVTFDIYGPIEDKDYWEVCKKEITNLPSDVSVNYKGLIDHDYVFDVLSQYDAFLFPTLSENFGHVISEALFSECPVIISDQTPWRGLEEAYAGWDIALDNTIGFRNAIQTIINKDNEQLVRMRKLAKAFAKKQFEMDKLRNDYIRALS